MGKRVKTTTYINDDLAVEYEHTGTSITLRLDIRDEDGDVEGEGQTDLDLTQLDDLIDTLTTARTLLFPDEPEPEPEPELPEDEETAEASEEVKANEGT